MTLPLIAFYFVALLSLIAAYFDIRYFIIPNWISIALIVGFVIFAFVSGFSFDQWLWRIGIAALVFVVGLGLFSLRMMGGGDVKLLAATSLWIEGTVFLPFIFYISLFGAGLALIIMLALAIKTLRRGEKLTRKAMMKSEIPYGVAIAAGAILATFPYSLIG